MTVPKHIALAAQRTARKLCARGLTHDYMKLSTMKNHVENGFIELDNLIDGIRACRDKLKGVTQ